MQSVFGALFYQFTGTPMLYKRPCNSPRCLPGGGSFRFEYLFPTSILPLILRVNGTWNDLSGLGGSWTFRIPQHLPREAFTVYTLIHQENPLSVEKYLDIHKISARALDPVSKCSLLQRAVRSRRVATCRLLLERGADMYHCDDTNRLTIAQTIWTYILGSPADRKNFALLRPTLESSDSLDTLGFTIIHKIVTGLSTFSLAQALELHPELVNAPDAVGEAPLHWAFRRTDHHSISLLLARGADPNARGHKNKTALHYIGPGSEFIPCMQLLIDAGADVNASDDTQPASHNPLVITAMYGNFDAAKLLLESGADPNHPGAAPLVYAAWLRGLEFVEAFINAGANINRVDDGYNSIMLAVQANALDRVQYLIKKGARLDYVSGETCSDGSEGGCSVVVLAAGYGSISVMNSLAEQRIRRLPTDEKSLKRYWYKFDKMRDLHFVGERTAIEKERKAFQDLLASLYPREDDLSEDDGGELGKIGRESQEPVDEEDESSFEEVLNKMPGAWVDDGS
ncbi:ankyrin repeat-containing domain protein [Podospora didyma]|uniref:Ankyrin repeat-containing domain protein n=1 Tax=Podospora didyma TaxID=330526 RepID=A0AAE0NYI8_9PEZI|nr:ankyrin repeat-containing domain protein [Podospora didyma]